jgi:hypothetical protein
MFGVLTDFHATRRDGGIPTFFDGWYSHRASPPHMEHVSMSKSAG